MKIHFWIGKLHVWLDTRTITFALGLILGWILFH